MQHCPCRDPGSIPGEEVFYAPFAQLAVRRAYIFQGSEKWYAEVSGSIPERSFYLPV